MSNGDSEIASNWKDPNLSKTRARNKHDLTKHVKLIGVVACKSLLERMVFLERPFRQKALGGVKHHFQVPRCILEVYTSMSSRQRWSSLLSFFNLFIQRFHYFAK